MASFRKLHPAQAFMHNLIEMEYPDKSNSGNCTKALPTPLSGSAEPFYICVDSFQGIRAYEIMSSVLLLSRALIPESIAAWLLYIRSGVWVLYERFTE